MDKFEQNYQLLNDNQRLAVDTLEGPVMVIAGPGTGKTQVLTLRIANLIKSDVAEPENILALTFTNAAAANMRKRLVEMIGVTGYQVRICTFHAFCSTIIGDNGQYFPLNQKSEALSDLATYEIFEEILTKLRLQKLRSTKEKFYYLKDIISSISTLKREGVSEAEFEKIVETQKIEFAQQKDELKKPEIKKWQTNIAKWEDLILIYNEYQQLLQKKNLFDYSDMINFVKDAFIKHEDLLLNYQEQFQYLLVDEYQDTNGAQDNIIDLLTSYWKENANVFVVGDPNQSIYRFQGASLENFLGFVERYPKAQIVGLDIGYRCSQNTYDIATLLIDRNEFSTQNGKKISLPKLKNYQQKIGSKLTINSYINRDLEIENIAAQIKKLNDQGVKYSDMAILYKKNKESLRIQEILSANNIPIEVDSDDNILENLKVEQFIKLLTLVVNLDQPYKANQLFYEVIQYEWLKIPNLSTLKLVKLVNENKLKLLDLFYDEDKLQILTKENNLNIAEFEPLQKLWKLLLNWKQLDINQRLHQTILTIFNDCKLLNFINENEDRFFILSCFYTFINHVRDLEKRNRDTKLADLIKTLTTMEHHGLKINVHNFNIRDNAVHLSTVHKAKGCEWSHVFVTGVIDGNWGNERERAKIKLPENILKFEQKGEAQNEETKRLLYVAITRAKQEIILSYPETIVEENNTSQKLPSQFLVSIGKHNELVEVNQIESEQEQIVKTMTDALLPKNFIDSNEDEKAYFKILIEDFVLSPSSLNDYLFDKQSFINNYLLRAPQINKNEANLNFGVAFHSALQKLMLPKLHNDSPPNLEQISQIFTTELEKKYLDDDDFYYFNKVGLKYLAHFYEQQVNKETKIISLEKNFGSSYPIVVDGVKIKGKVDRIDLIENNEAVIIDYKTGTPKTDSEICKLDKKASECEKQLDECLWGRSKRQLLFYKILSEVDPKFKHNATHGMLYFVVGDDHKKPVQRKIAFNTDEIEAMKKLIKKVDCEIRELKFLKNDVEGY